MEFTHLENMQTISCPFQVQLLRLQISNVTHLVSARLRRRSTGTFTATCSFSTLARTSSIGIRRSFCGTSAFTFARDVIFLKNYAVEITINYFARQYVDEKHKFIKETLSTSKETYHHRLCRLVRDHDFVSIAKVELVEESNEVYEENLRKKCTINRGLLPKIGLIS